MRPITQFLLLSGPSNFNTVFLDSLEAAVDPEIEAQLDDEIVAELEAVDAVGEVEPEINAEVEC